MTDLPDSGGRINPIMIVANEATIMTRLSHCSKLIAAAKTVRLYMRYIVKLHRVPTAIYTERDTKFVSKFWRELWVLLGTSCNDCGLRIMNLNVEISN